MFDSGPDPPDPPNRPEMTGNVGPGPPKNSPTVEPRIKNTKYRPKVSHVYVDRFTGQTCQFSVQKLVHTMVTRPLVPRGPEPLVLH